MATITTSTVVQAVAGQQNVSIDRCVTTGHLWAAVRTTSTQVSLFKSTDNGASWGSQGSFTRSGMYELGEMRIDSGGDQMHITWCENASSLDKVMYKRIDIRSGTADLSSGEALLAQSTAASAGDFYEATSIAAIRNLDGSYFVLVVAAFNSTYSGVYIYPVYVKNAAAGFNTTYTPTLVSSTRQYRLSGLDSAIAPCIDYEHNGDGSTASSPNVWLSFQIGTTCYAVKMTWNGNGWNSPTTAAVVASGRSATARDLPGRWDGSRFVILSQRPSNTSQYDVFERNSANTGNSATRTSPTHPQGATTSGTLSYNHSTKDFRLFAQGTSTAGLYYVDYIRATDTWGSWTSVSGTNPASNRHGVRRSTAGTYQYDQYQVQGASSPWSIINNSLAVNFTPYAPPWITGTAGTVPTNGAAADVSASLTFDWDFLDPNTSDTQNQYALQRQIGAAAAQWWRTSDSSWQSSETFNTSATSAVTLTSGQWPGAGGGADSAHVYKVAVKDSGGLTSAYSAGLAVVPSVRIDPTLTAPTTGSTLNTGLVTATWTVSEQTAYRVTVTNTATSTVVYDTGFIAASLATLTHQVGLNLPDGFAGSLTLQTKNNEGLTSVTRTATFTIDFVEPVAPIISAIAAAPQSGGINVTTTQAAVSGAQPATIRMDLWRRKLVSTAVTNANPYFETNASDWTNNNFSSIARSTAQAHQGAASLLCTPNGTQATPYAETSGYAAVAGTPWEIRGWFRATTTNKTVRVRLRWYNSTPTLISESVRDLTPVAGTWIWFYYSANAPASTATVRMAVGEIGTPAAGDTVYFDELELVAANIDVGIPIAEGITSAVPVLDWRAVGGVAYEYRSYAVAANGTDVYGPWAS